MLFTRIFFVISSSPHKCIRAKDIETTQAAVGFRISGIQVYRVAEGTTFKPDKNWGKTLDKVGLLFVG